MASVYRKSTSVYYLAVTFQNSQISRSLGTRCYKTAKKVTPDIEKQILSELINGLNVKKPKKLSFNNLVREYLEYQGHDWVNSTRKRNKELLNKYLVKGFPNNSTTKAMTIRVINALLNCRAFVFHILSYLFINNQKVDTKMVGTLFTPL